MSTSFTDAARFFRQHSFDIRQRTKHNRSRQRVCGPPVQHKGSDILSSHMRCRLNRQLIPGGSSVQQIGALAEPLLYLKRSEMRVEDECVYKFARQAVVVIPH
jgi:hypothetical protein